MISVSSLAQIEKKLYNAVSIHRRKRFWKNEVSKRLDRNIRLTKNEILSARRYYAPYLKINTQYHQFYKQKTGKYYDEYIPDDLYYCYIDPYFNKWDEAVYLDNKCYYYQLFRNIKQPDMIAMRMNNIWYRLNGEELVSISEDEAYTGITCYDCFVKEATNSEGGHGVYFFPEGTEKSNFSTLLSKINCDVVVQKEIKQSPELSVLSKSSVNTIRVLSLLNQCGGGKTYIPLSSEWGLIIQRLIMQVVEELHVELGRMVG